MSDGERTRFAVIYRWRLKEGGWERFRNAWSRLTRAIRDERGGLGSRLHRGRDGLVVAYAQWPSREAWEQGFAAGSVDPRASGEMRAVIEETLEPILLDVDEDLLVHAPGDSGDA